MVDTYHYTFVKTHRVYTRPRVNPTINHGLWVIMMCHVGSSVVTNVPVGQRCWWLGKWCVCRGRRCGNSELSAQFCCQSKTVLQNRLLMKTKVCLIRHTSGLINMTELQNNVPHLSQKTIWIAFHNTLVSTL